jgi:hypothetical protein
MGVFSANFGRKRFWRIFLPNLIDMVDNLTPAI